MAGQAPPTMDKKRAGRGPGRFRRSLSPRSVAGYAQQGISLERGLVNAFALPLFPCVCRVVDDLLGGGIAPAEVISVEGRVPTPQVETAVEAGCVIRC